MLYLSGIIITFFLAAILWSKKGKSTADNILAAWLCVIGFHLFLFYLFNTDRLYEYPWMLGITLPFPLLHGPLLYLYVLTSTRTQQLHPRMALHLIPAILTYIGLIPFFKLTPEEKIYVFRHQGAGFEWFNTVIVYALIVSGFTYVFFSLLELHRYKKSIADRFSDIEKINLQWLRYLIFGILAIWLVIAFLDDDKVIFGVVVIFVVFLGYFGIKHVGVFTYQQTLSGKSHHAAKTEVAVVHQRDDLSSSFIPAENTPAPSPEEGEGGSSTSDADDGLPPDSASEPGTPVKLKYERSGLLPEIAEKIHADLNRMMSREKSYRESELTLAGLADLLNIHPHTLSQVINTYEHKNFYDYINQLRVEEFKHIVHLPKNRQFTLLSLAFEAGFNSKTAFNRNFKKVTGLSPSAYLKEEAIELAEN